MANALSRGFTRDTVTDALAVTTNAVGALPARGFLRSPSDELVVTTDGTGAVMRGGWLVSPSGALVINNGGSGSPSNGFLRDSTGALVVATSGGLADAGGFARDASGRLLVSGLTPFSPTDLAGLAVWFKADTLVLADAAPVTAWTDSSGNVRDLAQATPLNQPVYKTAQINGLPAVRFDGTNSFMATANWASPTAGVTVVAAFKPAVVTAGAYRTLLCHAAAATWASPFARYMLRENTASAAWDFEVQDASTAPGTLQDVTSAVVEWHVRTGMFDLSNIRMYRQSTEISASPKAFASALTSSNFPLYVGCQTDLANKFNGDLAELIVYSTSLSGSDRLLVENYLRTKYAL